MEFKQPYILPLSIVLFLSGCASTSPSITVDPYSGGQVVSSDYFYSLNPVSWTEIDRIAFKYDYTENDSVILRSGYLTSAGAATGQREGIVNVNELNFMIDGKEFNYKSELPTNYSGMKSCNEVGICSVADGSYNSYIVPTSFLKTLENADKVMVKLTLGNFKKVAILKDQQDTSDAYDSLMQLNQYIKNN